MNALGSQLTEADLEEQLRTLPDNIDATYDAIVERLRELPTVAKRNLAWNSLAWIVLSKRRLQTEELQHALACIRGAQRLDPRMFYDLEDMQELCGGLIGYTNNTVSLVHYTAQSYFATRAHELFRDFHDVIAQSCIRYIGFFSLSAVSGWYEDVAIATAGSVQRPQHWGTQEDDYSIPSETPFYDVFEDFPFVHYAISHLKYHLNSQSGDQGPRTTLDMLVQLLNDQGKRNFLFHALKKLKLYPVEAIATMKEEREEVASTTRHEAHPESLDDDAGSSSLMSSVSEISSPTYEGVAENEELDGNIQSLETRFEALLEAHMERIGFNIQPESVDEEQMVPIKKLILEIIDNVKERKRAALRRKAATDGVDHAREMGSQPAVRASTIDYDYDSDWSSHSLEHKNALINQDWCAPSLLHLAVCLGWIPLVNHMAQSSNDINAVDSNGLTPLCVATLTENSDAVEDILSHQDVFVDLSTTEGHTVLLCLACNQRFDLIERILSRTLSPLLFTPVPYAFQVCRFIIAKTLLLLWGVKIYWRVWVPQPVTHQQRCCLYDLQLLAAAHRGHLSVIKELIDSKKVNFELTKRFATTALFLAVASDQVEVVKYLLDHGVELNNPGPRGMTPLHLATQLDKTVMVDLLLKKGADVSAKDNDGNLTWRKGLHVANCRERKNML